MESGQTRAGLPAGLSKLELAALGLVAVFTALAAIGRYTSAFPQILSFVLAALALAGMAWMVSTATEQIGTRFSPSVTGVLQSTIGNLPEFFVVLFALEAGHVVVAETALLGSILVNALLVLGLVMVAASWRTPAAVRPDGTSTQKGVMKFSVRLPNDTATLLLVASFLIVLLAIVNGSADSASRHTETISTVGAAVLLVVYLIWLPQYLRRDSSAPDEREPPRISIPVAGAMLGIAGVGSAFVSDWFVYALEPTIHTLHLSQAFAGIVIVAIAGNAVENAAGIWLAFKGKNDLAIAVVKNSVAQIAAFLYPLMVLVSLLTASHLTFALAPVYAGALGVSAILIWQITSDGEATVFEGSALIGVYVVLAVIAAFEN
jgi:Ca2+:H+ antiporter